MKLTAEEEGRTVISKRTVPAPRDVVFDAYADAKKLVRWWGPHGFTITTQEIDVVTGGEWRFVLHGPDGKDYKNHIRFGAIERPSRFVVDHISGPYYLGTVLFDEVDGGTQVTMVWTFRDQPVFDKIKDIVAEGNEGNFDRMWRVVSEPLPPR